MQQYNAIPRKYKNELWITIPKRIIKKEKINPKCAVDVLVSKNLVVICQQ